MTEMTTVAQAREEKRLCRSGSKSDNPCQREATHRRWEDDPEPTVCAEHALLARLVDDADDLRMDLDALDAWARSREPRSGDMERLVAKARDDLRTEYARAQAEVRAAALVADNGLPAWTNEQARGLAHLLIRSDALNGARTFLEDLPEDEAPGDRWLMVDALETAVRSANREFEHRREELGLAR